MNTNFIPEPQETTKKILVVDQVITIGEKQLEAILTKEIEATGQYKVKEMSWNTRPSMADDGFGGQIPSGQVFSNVQIKVGIISQQE
jgi:hypothetical protein